MKVLGLCGICCIFSKSDYQITGRANHICLVASVQSQASVEIIMSESGPVEVD
jgi:hypothetical protein